MIRLIDTHTHLEEIEDLSEAIGRAEKSGVLGIITVGSDYESNKTSPVSFFPHALSKRASNSFHVEILGTLESGPSSGRCK